MKYKFDLDMSTDNSLSIILRNIKANSTVLEFGSAHGRMTKYLKEKLNCNVYIVEVDMLAGKEAAAFAVDYLIGDIEQYHWVEKFDGISFDYIIFADVLEHLYNPQKVLERSKLMLKEDGSIFISVPNIAHNAILIDLLNNKFDYKELGLLDNTHIRFFTYNSIIKLLNDTRLIPVKQLATYSKVGETEFNNSYDDVDKALAVNLKTRDFGEIYQFVMKVKKDNYVKENKENITIENAITKIQMHYYMQTYVDCGNGLNEENSVKSIISEQKNIFEFELSKYEGIRKVRIDPVNTSCIVKIDEISITYTDETSKKANITGHNATFNIENIYIFETDDPQIYIETSASNNISKIEVLMQIYSLEIDLNRNYKYLDNILSENIKKLKISNEEIEKLKIDLEEKSKNYLLLQEDFKLKLEESVRKNVELRNNLEEESKKYLLLQQDLRLKIEELTQKNKECEELKNNLQVKNEAFNILEEELNINKDIINEIINSRSWKITAPLRKIANYFKR